MTARLMIGDVHDRLAELPDNSVDLFVTSPPFLALRSYLPADHPDKRKEIGSEPTPAAFIDTLLALTAEWRRILAPHGSICVELGDSFSGSGGAGGDYGPDGMRGGQEKFTGSELRHRKNKVLNDKGQRLQQGPGWPLAKSLTGIPTLYPWSLAYGRNLLTGEPSPAGRWRIRNVIVWARPNPPVGALGDKFRPATSYITVACTGPKRYFDLDAVRTENPNGQGVATAPATRSDASRGRQYEGNGGNHSFPVATSNPAGAPPLDWHSDMPDEDGDWLWKLATQPYSGMTSTVRRVPCGPDDGGERTTSPDCPRHADLPGQLSKALRDERATANRSPSRRTQHSDDRHEPEPLPGCGSTDPHLEQVTPAQSLFPADTPAASPHSTPSRRTDHAPATTPLDTPSVRTDGRTGHTSTSPASSAPGANSDESNTTSDGSPASPGSRTSDGTGDIATSSELPCTCSFHKLTHESTSHYATFPLALPSRLIQAMCPQRVCTVCGKPSERITEQNEAYRAARATIRDGDGASVTGRDTTLERGKFGSGGGAASRITNGLVSAAPTTLGWSECGHDSYRPGLVLDPFSGSGTTLAAAIGCGRDAIGIDLDDRNAALTRERCGLFVETETGAP